MAAVTQTQPLPPTQSWAAWLLDSYASSVSPVNSHHDYHDHDHDNDHDNETLSHYSSFTNSPAHTPMSSISNSSAYGPYVRTGRGGAGNFTWQSTESKPPAAATTQSPAAIDLEAQKSSSSSSSMPPPPSLSERRAAAAKLENINTQEAVRLRQSSAQYVHAGRGGAGNFISSSEIALAKRSPSLPLSLTSGGGGAKGSSGSPVYNVHPGRGGAGNYAASAESSTRKTATKEQQEKAEADLRREQIIYEVDGLLQPPPGAWLGGRRRSEVMHEEV